MDSLEIKKEFAMSYQELVGYLLKKYGAAQYEEAESAFRAALESADSRMKENVRDIELYLATAQYRAEDYEDTMVTCDEILKGGGENENADAY